MPPNQKVFGIALVSTALGSALIAILAALLRRRRRKDVTARPDVLNEAHPLDLSLLGSDQVDKLEVETLCRLDGELSVSQKSLSTISQVSSLGTLTNGNTAHYSLQQLCHLGNQHLQRAERVWEEALARRSIDHTSSQNVSPEQLRDLLVKVRDLQALYQSHFESDVSIDTAVGALKELDADYDRKLGRSVTSDEGSLDSFVSAQETPDLSDLEEKILAKPSCRLHLYEVGLLELQHNLVPYRKLRTKMVGCGSDSEFLAKLHVLRIALDEVMKEKSNKEWFTSTGRTIVSSILIKAERDPTDFLSSMNKLEAFLPSTANFDVLKTELGSRGVKCFTLYDIVLDWVLMDAFDDLCNPPASVLSVVKNRWLSDGLKETAISTAIWSILKAKRRLLKHPDGFIAKFYAISESVTPVLAWAFLGPDGELKSACQTFRTQCMGFIEDIFNQRTVRYTVYEDMVCDIMKVARLRAANILSAIDPAHYSMNGL